MGEFTPINTQDEFDAAIKDRLQRQESKIRGEYSDYDDLKEKAGAWDKEKTTLETTISENKTKYDNLEKEYDEAKKKIAKYETDALKTSVAIESGIPIEMREYLKGETEEEIKKSAETLAKFTKKNQVPPLADPEDDPPKDKTKAALRKMLKEMKGE